MLGVAATLTASASALPGEPLYGLKQAHEELNVRLAADDQARALALLGQADARLDETARLLQQGRTDAALETTQRYGQVVDRATTTFVSRSTRHRSSRRPPNNWKRCSPSNRTQLQTMLQTAPEPARADLREALVTTERGRALVADPRPVGRALGKARGDRLAAPAAVATTATEDLPTAAPTRRPTVVPVGPPPPPNVVVAQATQQPTPDVIVAQGPGRSADSASRGRTTAPGASQRAQPQLSQPQLSQPAAADDEGSSDDGAISPPEVALDDGGAGSGADRNANASGRGRAADQRANTAQTAVPQVPSLPDQASAPESGRENGNSHSGGPPGREQPTPTLTASPRGVAVTDGKDAARPAAVPSATTTRRQASAAIPAAAASTKRRRCRPRRRALD